VIFVYHVALSDRRDGTLIRLRVFVFWITASMFYWGIHGKCISGKRTSPKQKGNLVKGVFDVKRLRA
jgi:hypothetical protein